MKQPGPDERPASLPPPDTTAISNGGAGEQSLSEIFARVLDADPLRRRGLIDELCGGDPELTRNVVELVTAVERAPSTGRLMRQVLDAGPEPLSPGTRVGTYVIERMIATGGMGIVYLARDSALDMRVAIKALKPEMAGHEGHRRRLKAEARTMAQLASHPNIATVHALLEQGDTLYIVEECLEGPTLRERLARGPLEVAELFDVGDAVSSALDAAHRQRIVHRDLKPENVMRNAGGVWKVLDFGIAKVDAPNPRTTLYQTAADERAGTIGYMSPEQLRGEALDGRSDLFAFGVLLYELATGRHPFERGGILSTWSAVLFDSASPLRPEELARLPPRLIDVIDRCLAKDPADRWPSAESVATALRAVERGSTSLPPPAAGAAAVRWWQFHETAAAVIYWLLLIPVWHVRPWLAPPHWRILFVVLLAALAVAPSLRLSLAFVTGQHPAGVHEHYRRCIGWIRAGDVAFALALAAAGLLIFDAHTGWAALLLSFGIGSLVVAHFIEPLTARQALAALGRQASSSTGDSGHARTGR